jgi:hypothetical protein
VLFGTEARGSCGNCFWVDGACCSLRMGGFIVFFPFFLSLLTLKQLLTLPLPRDTVVAVSVNCWNLSLKW